MKKKIKIEYENEENDGNEENNENNEINIKKDKDIKKIIINDDEEKIKACQHQLSYHKFKTNEIKEIRKLMLEWYEKSKRDLPWRVHEGVDENVKAYRIWVSEIMLQQTRVITVIDYFNRWIKKWPTIKDLANSTIEEVNQLWSGLGYYRRAKNLYLGSKYVIENFKGIIPKEVKKLLEIPGIGAYTAGAISSIAFGMQEPLVDGNVIRVFSRLRSIGANPKNSKTVKLFWSIGSDIVDPQNPGEFNQSLMELGATVCSVQSPQCKQCPVQTLCQAYKEEKSFIKPKPKNSISNFFQPKTENNSSGSDSINNSSDNSIKKEIPLKDICTVCESFDDTDGPTESVCKYPKKVLKIKPRSETVNVFLIHHYQADKFLLVQRPDTGLLASLFEAPSIIVKNETEEDEDEADEDEDEEEDKKKKSKKRKQISKSNSDTAAITNDYIQKEVLNNLFLKKTSKNNTIINLKSFKSIGTVIHKFSHITQTLNVFDCKCEFDINNLPKSTIPSKNIQWIELSSISSLHGMAKQMSKCFDLLK
ncbi:hypothetical protein DICPUDRAFT_156172 [Dictyostelium purpureum]|uniref:Adenine DNA glycosylase n=1 Tax=Dictyostelium purpureum TaxID=5786 RepID=F0ZVW8_DICPU|nr:uncharacterized protein DICPUDRAFT_156172 [Dictyostelium purpureum]EGC31926.1 hypothetical protein DICPUDRAFT_156172 [Dictyostelium purpureum]|eukprot:XP_003291563.1 hypothetical protein DICPUDRAFT_156172 [Dictyostelium purpureum]